MSERYVFDAVALIRILDGDAPMSIRYVYDMSMIKPGKEMLKF